MNPYPGGITYYSPRLSECMGIWVSHASVFILGALGLGCLWKSLRSKRWSSLPALLVLFLGWAASFAAFYFVSLRSLTHNDYLLNYWQRRDAFAPFPPTSLAQLRWYVDTPFHIFTFPGGFDLPDVAALAWIFGCIAFWRKNRARLLVLIVPALLTWLASTLHEYPFQGRLLLFLVPLILLAVGEGAAAMIQATRQTMPWFSVVFLGLLFLYPAFEAAYHVAVPRKTQELRPLLASLKEQYREGDTVYVYWATQSLFAYYAEREHLETIKPVLGAAIGRDSRVSVAQEVEKVRGRNRVWFLLTRTMQSDGVNQEDMFVAQLNRFGKRLECLQSKGASVYLYDLRPGGGSDGNDH